MALYKRALLKRFKTKYAPDEIDKLALLIILAFLTIFGIMGCIEAYADTLSFEVKNNCIINNNTISNDSYNKIFYANVIKGHTYTITLNFEYGESSPSGRQLNYGFSNSVDVGSQVTNVTFVRGDYGEVINLTFVALDDYIVIVSPSGNFSNYANLSNFSIVEEVNMQSVSDNLATNVGPQQIWDTFTSSIDFVYIVVIVAFGIFLIVLAIRKVTKGKSEF